MWGSTITGQGLFGNGAASGNIIQGGSALQPQIYNLPGVGLLGDCIVVTGAATVAPDGTTGAAVATGRHLVVIGAGASLSASTNCKSLILIFNGGVFLRNGGRIHMDKLGLAGAFGPLSSYDLLPAAVRKRVSKAKHQGYVLSPTGAAGGAPPEPNVGGTPGSNAGAMQTGGGGTGARSTIGAAAQAGAGGRGGTCCGGGGSGGAHHGTSPDAPDYGAGGAATCPDAAGGGAGQPVGASVLSDTPPTGCGGGVLLLFAAKLDIGDTCTISVDGGVGGTNSAGNVHSTGGGAVAGGSAGGGIVALVNRPGAYTSTGTVRASGGASAPDNIAGFNYDGGRGGDGSVNLFAAA